MASEEERPVRPGSLVPPEKQPLQFDVQLLGAPPHVEQLVNNIKQVAEEYLYHWKTFPIVLPTSWCLGGGKAVRLQELLLAPALEELDALAVDDKGEPRRLSRKQLHAVRQRGVHKDKPNKPKRLNAKQLESIRERGEFEVWSRNFPGQRHVWRVSGALQRGRARARATLSADAARAAALVLLIARDRLFRDTALSLIAGLKALLLGFQRLLDLLMGLPALAAHDLEHKLREERARYLVAELVAKEGHTCESWSVCGWLTRQLRRARVEKFDAVRECARASPRVPFLYTTPRNDNIDLRLFARDTMRRAQPLLVSILEREARGWFLHFRERLLNQLRDQKVPNQDIDQEVREAGMREYMSRVSAAVRSSTALALLGDGIPTLLVQQMQATVLMHRSVEQVKNRLAQGRAGLRERLLAAYPLRARIPRWLHEKLEEANTRAEAEARWAAHEEAAAACTVHGLHQHAYFLQRDLAFMREREPLLLKELREVKSATRTFTWARQRWRVAHWVVERRCEGTVQRMPVTMAPRATPAAARSDPTQPVYLLRRHTQYQTTTRWPGWRIANYAYRTWTWCWNTMFLLGIVIPWCSPLSIRALFCVQPFMPDYELSQVNGTLFPRKSSSTETVYSRLRALWRHISKARTHFETKPDTGLIGKGVTRLVNRTWNYGVKGVIGSTLLLLLLPLMCATVSVVSCLAALFAPFWVPLVALATHVACAMLYDFDCPDPVNRNRYLCVAETVLWRICVLGLLQPAAALLVAVFCVPTALLLLAAGCARWCMRSAWDILIFRCVIKRRARVPAGDGVFAKRVAGPGLHHNYYFHIRAEQALCALTARVELEELAAWARNTEAAITRPLRDYAHFVSACFSPFSCQLAKSGPYQQLEKECGELVASLREKVEARRRELDLALSQELRARVKLSASDLKVTIAAGARLAARVHPARNLAPGAADDWWGARGLAPLDWPALVAQLLAETFALEVLAPLGEEDVSFRLEPHSSLDLSRYQAMIRDLDTDSCPDVVCDGGALASVVWGAAPRVQPPCLDTGVFNPRPQVTLKQHATARSEAQHHISWMHSLPIYLCWQRETRTTVPPIEPISRLPIPLPLPHPAMIALIIHNREAEFPIPLDNDLCVELLRAVEDVAVDYNQQESLEAATPVSSNDSLETAGDVAADTLPCQPAYHWTLTNWGGHRRHASSSVRVDLASPEDVTLDADSARVNFASGGTSV